MIIVGVGVGPGMLTEAAIDAIQKAPVVYGSGRALEIAKKYITGRVETLKEYKNFHLLPKDAVLLSTGDPMFSGLGKFAGPDDIVISGISSFQYSCSKLHIDLAGISFITAHGRDDLKTPESAFIRDIKSGKNIFLLPDKNFGIPQISEILLKENINATIYSLEELGYPEEKILKGTPKNPPKPTSILFSVLVELK
ncbi:MAG: precorrin-6y C5,15-methyltransferase (decarboxylating) subunit CbiE [Methanosarcinaceae archaeon]|nr:precorrin-6y C5,15-methyltransferase (decarboxylating) subunit CbiE [Methanosarcinaceae archaeon]